MLSPGLLNIYLKLLGVVINNFGAQCHRDADDMQLYLSITSDSGEPVQALDQCLNAVVDWMRALRRHMGR